MLAVACAWSGAAPAATWYIDPSIESKATWTDNVNFEQPAQQESAAFLEVIPSVTLRGEGKRFRIAGTVGFDGVAYANGTRDSYVLPAVDLKANMEAIQGLFFVDAGIVSRQEAQDVFAPRTGAGPDFNTVNTTQYTLDPRLEGRLGSDITYRVLSANSWTSVSGGQSSDDGAYLGDNSLFVEKRAAPFGWRIEGDRNYTRFESSTPPSATITSGRLSLIYAVTQTVQFAVRGGYEKTDLVVQNDKQTIYGAELNWRPSERTDLGALWEERFFGGSYRFHFNHRMPRLAWNISISRDVVTFPQAFLTLPPTNNVAGLLDAAFTTRFPDPNERSRFISDLMNRQGLPSSLTTETSLFAQRVSILTSRTATVAFIGAQNVLAVSGFSSRNEDLPDSVFVTAGTVSNVAQDGISLTLSHQASALFSVNVTAGYTRTRGIGIDDGLQSKLGSLQVQATRQLASKTSAFCGARVQKFDSNVDIPSAHEHAVFAGLSHRF